MHPKTILFDMDGTLLDSISGLMMSTNAALTACGYPTRTYDEVASFVGNGVGKLIERALPGGLANPDYDRCLAAFRKDYQTAMFTGTKHFPGIVPLLKTLRDEGFHMAVVSNKPDPAVKELAVHFFGELLPVAIGEREGVSRKPAPDSVLAALKEMGMPAESAVYIGDSEVDLATARNSGLPCFSVDWGSRTREFLLEHGAASIAHTPAELLEQLHAYFGE